MTKTDHDFVDVTVRPTLVARMASKLVRGAAIAAVVTMLAVPAHAVTARITTTFHHPFYDITQPAFVEGQNLRPGDELQSVDGGRPSQPKVRMPSEVAA